MFVYNYVSIHVTKMATNMKGATFVVVGGGIAGISCIEGLSFLQPDTEIILISSSPLIKAVTNVVNVTKILCKFDIEEKEAETLSEKYPNVQVIEDKLQRVDTKDHHVVTASGLTIFYRKLCICTGGEPKLIAENNPNVIGLRDTESVQEFQARVSDARKIMVVGNGGIATEVVYNLKNMEITWVIKDKHISATFVDPGAAEFFQTKLLQKKIASLPDPPIKRMKYTQNSGQSSSKNSSIGAALGPDWHMGIEMCGRNTNVEELKVSVEYECEVRKVWNENPKGLSESDGTWPVYAELTNGKVIGCDFIVSATGVVPNCKMFAGDTLELAEDMGLKVNCKMETNDPDVFAAGDACCASWEKAKHWFQMRLWTQARQMGLYVAKSMVASFLGEPVIQDFCFELFSHITTFFGFKIVLLGLYNGQTLEGDYEILLRTTTGVEYIKLVMKEGRLQGAVLIGETDLEEMCENLILNQLDLSAFGEDLLNPNIDIEDYFD